MLGADMRPSSTIFDPGLERAAPWGRDLFTFVTSAAGYMMRTLQKPRKNKPSKRQVNHRRFLHNMIQRKFAEIEAANQQLASVLLAVESETQTPPDAKSTHNRDSEKNTENASEPDASKRHRDKENDVDARRVRGLVVNSSTSHSNIKQSNDLNSETDGRPWKAGNDLLLRPDYSQPHAGPAYSHAGFLEDAVIGSPYGTEETRPDSDTRVHESPNEEEEGSLGLSYFDASESPLSVDSSDFNVHTNGDELDVMGSFDFLDFPEGTGRHTPSRPTDRTDPGSVWHAQGGESRSFFRETPAVLQSLYRDQSGDVTESPQMRSQCEDSDWTSGEDPENNTAYFGSSRDEDGTERTGATMEIYRHRGGPTGLINKADECSLAGSWSQSDAIKKAVQASEISHHSVTELGLSGQFQMKYWDQRTQEDRDRARSVDTDAALDDGFETPDLNAGYPGLRALPSAHCRSSEGAVDFWAYTGGDHDRAFHSFDGVAQSFPAPVQDRHPYPVSTPPLNDDWLFGDIVMDGDSAGTVRSPGCASCWRNYTNEYAVVLD